MSSLAPVRRATRLLSLRRTLGCWSRSLAGPPRRAAAASAACARAVRPPQVPRLRRGPLLGACLPAVLDGTAAPGEAWSAAPGEARGAARGGAPGKESGGEPGGARGTVPAAAGAATPPLPRRPPDRTAVARSERHEIPRSARSADRELLCRLAGEPSGQPAAGTARRAPAAATVERRPGPPPCAPDAALAPATARAARRLAAGAIAPAGQCMPGPAATAQVLYRHASRLCPVDGGRFAGPDIPGERAAQPNTDTMRPAWLPASGRGPDTLEFGRGGRPVGHAGHGLSGHGLSGADLGGAGWRVADEAAASGTARPDAAWPASGGESGLGPGDAGPTAGRARRRRAAWPGAGGVDSSAARHGGPYAGAAWPEGGSGAPPGRARGDQPTASERLGAAPVVTPSHPALVGPERAGAPAIPAASGTLRRGAARDAQPPDFLDNAELTARMAQVLRDEARRHGIGV